MTSLLMFAGRRAAGFLALACLPVLAAVVPLLPAHAAGVRGLAEPPDAVALVKRVAGHAELWRGGVRQPLQEGQSLVATDRLQMGADGTAALVFRDGTRLTLGNASELQLRRYAFVAKADGCDDCAFDVYLSRGRAVYASGKIGKLAPQSVLLETPHGTAGVRGTRLILEVD